jgi:metallo-beta-lactamase family protein
VSTRWTGELARIVIQDAAHLQEEQEEEAAYADAKGFSKHRPALPSCTGEDAAAVFELFRPVDYHAPLKVAEGVVVELVSAGHIVGSASALVTIDGVTPSRVFFGGDVGRPNHPILRAPETPPAADVLLVESTYGNRLHEPEEQALDRMADVIVRAARHGGTVVIPSFAVDRTEVLLIALGRLVTVGKVRRSPSSPTARWHWRSSTPTAVRSRSTPRTCG